MLGSSLSKVAKIHLKVAETLNPLSHVGEPYIGLWVWLDTEIQMGFCLSVSYVCFPELVSSAGGSVTSSSRLLSVSLPTSVERPLVFPKSSSKNPGIGSDWLSLGHVPILEPVTMAGGLVVLIGHAGSCAHL